MSRYLKVAQWLLEQKGPVSSREIAHIFNVSSWAISSDFAKICRQPEIFECRETKEITEVGREHFLHVLYINPYIVNKRGMAEIDHSNNSLLNVQKTWRVLLSKPWRDMKSFIN